MSATAIAQQSAALTDADIVAMVRAGKSAAEVISAIAVCEPHFQLDPGSLAALVLLGHK
jgi:hypothetical protein